MEQQLYAALQQLYNECKLAGFEDANDYNWPKSMKDAKEALTAASKSSNLQSSDRNTANVVNNKTGD